MKNNAMKPSLILGVVIFIVSHVAAADLPVNEKIQKATRFFNDAEYSKAFDAFDMLDSELKTNAEFNYYYGLSLLKTAQTKQAITVMKRAIDLEPENADYRYALGLIYASRMAELSLFRAALMIGASKDTLLKAIELDPDHVGATGTLAEFLVDVPGVIGGDKEKSEELLNKLWTLDPASAATLEAKLERRSGNLGRAEELFLQAVETPDSEAGIRLKLAKFYVDQQKYSEAVTYGEEYLSLPKHWSEFSRDTAYAHLWLAIAYHALGDTVNFQKHSQAVDINNMPERVRKEIADSYEKAGIEF